MGTPKTVEEWAEEAKFALDEALSIQQESAVKEQPVLIRELYKMAPLIAVIFRKIEDHEIKEQIRQETWATVKHVHKVIPGYIHKYKRCFVHAYLDSMISLELISLTDSDNVLDLMEERGEIEHSKA